MTQQQFHISTGIPVVLQNSTSFDFKEQYIALRKKEQRVYTDEEVLQLPLIPGDHVHAKEWVVRKKSCRKLVNYLKKKGPLNILEIGCGNGWLSYQLSKIPGSIVTGMDINDVELKQAARVFSEQTNLSFINKNISQIELHNHPFDIIVFAASLQYFNSFSEIVTVALDHLKLGGEIHIIDSPFYQPNDIAEARQRTQSYFTELGFCQMQHHYFHHSVESFERFRHTILYNPLSLTNKLLKSKNPFYWIRIMK